MEDFLANMLEFGSLKNGWRSPWAIIGLILGLGLGAYFGWYKDGFVTAVGYGLAGGFFGWFLFVLLKGLMRFLAFFILAAAAIMAWYYLTGRL